MIVCGPAARVYTVVVDEVRRGGRKDNMAAPRSFYTSVPLPSKGRMRDGHGANFGGREERDLCVANRLMIFLLSSCRTQD